ncbi:MAG: hypothetical protein PVG22_19205 [Chromatiales bacterium]|jgi:hypothetical protein
MRARSTYLKVAALAALYLFWLVTWFVFGKELFGEGRHYWSQAVMAAATGLAALYVARHLSRPYLGFFFIQGIAYLLLAMSWVGYPEASGRCEFTLLFMLNPTAEQCTLMADLTYTLCVFALLCAWSYLALETWYGQPLSTFTMLVFVLLVLGLGAIFSGFYYSQYVGSLTSQDGRLDAITAVMEFAVLMLGLFCILLRLPAVVIWLLVGTAILVTGDMAYSVDIADTKDFVPPLIDAVWMFGQMLVLSAVIAIPEKGVLEGPHSAVHTGDKEASDVRSGLSGVLILISLGAALLSPLVWVLPLDKVWKSFFAVLFMIALVLILVRVTNRFDDTVCYLRGYVRRVLQSRLVSEDWRTVPAWVRAALYSTGLSAFLDEFRASAAQLKADVLFLGPERLFGMPKDLVAARKPTCFIVMPFSREWSADVHRILARECEAAGVRPVRGDDLFTPTDILEDIWQGINAADFVIADISGRNPNVLYELGIAHTLAKPVLILSREPSDIPIDLASRRVILYGQQGESWQTDLEQKIATSLATIVKDYRLNTVES